jgi:hypothetical protein
LFNNLKRIEGSGTVATYQIPLEADRVQMYFTTNGRPLKAKVELWVGPLRKVHNMEINVEDGSFTPFLATLKFKKVAPVLRVATKDALELPVIAGVDIASPERSAELDAITQKVWNTSPKTLIQGGSIEGGIGAVRIFPVADNVESVQVLFWSKDTGKKSLKAKIEVLHGPNNKKQEYDLQCGGGSQPYHAVFQTPGKGTTLRIYNKKYVEDGLVQCVVVPYRYVGDAPVTPPGSSEQWPKSSNSNRSWWE